jgi:two-component system, NarL family, nitrate/nitrite response regulator NarL
MVHRTVLVVDDHPVVRRGLRTMLLSEDWVTDVLEAATAEEAYQAAISQNADVIAMDVSLPDGNGIDATQRIVQTRPDVKVLILTMSDDEQLVQRALRVGASGYLLKDSDPDMVVDALRTVANGGLVLGPTIGPALVEALRRGPTDLPPDLPPPFDQLTARELQILALLAQGCTNVQIGRRIGLSDKTIRNQLSAVFVKIGVGDRVTAALRAREARIA